MAKDAAPRDRLHTEACGGTMHTWDTGSRTGYPVALLVGLPQDTRREETIPAIKGMMSS